MTVTPVWHFAFLDVTLGYIDCVEFLLSHCSCRLWPFYASMPWLWGNQPLHKCYRETIFAYFWAGTLQIPCLHLGIRWNPRAGACHLTDAGGWQLATQDTSRPSGFPVVCLPFQHNVEMTLDFKWLLVWWTVWPLNWIGFCTSMAHRDRVPSWNGGCMS